LGHPYCCAPYGCLPLTLNQIPNWTYLTTVNTGTAKCVHERCSPD